MRLQVFVLFLLFQLMRADTVNSSEDVSDDGDSPRQLISEIEKNITSDKYSTSNNDLNSEISDDESLEEHIIDAQENPSLNRIERKAHITRSTSSSRIKMARKWSSASSSSSGSSRNRNVAETSTRASVESASYSGDGIDASYSANSANQYSGQSNQYSGELNQYYPAIDQQSNILDSGSSYSGYESGSNLQSGSAYSSSGSSFSQQQPEFQPYNEYSQYQGQIESGNSQQYQPQSYENFQQYQPQGMNNFQQYFSQQYRIPQQYQSLIYGNGQPQFDGGNQQMTAGINQQYQPYDWSQSAGAQANQYQQQFQQYGVSQQMNPQTYVSQQQLSYNAGLQNIADSQQSGSYQTEDASTPQEPQSVPGAGYEQFDTSQSQLPQVSVNPSMQFMCGGSVGGCGSSNYIQPPPIYQPPQIIRPPPQIIRPPPQIIPSPPIIQPPRVIQLPPIIRPPQIIQSPPIIKPPVEIPSPPIIKPPEVIQPPPIYKPPRVIESPPIINPPRVIESPPIYRPAEVIQPPPVIKPPRVIESPPIYKPPQVINPPPIIREPEVIQPPPIYREPEVIQPPPVYKPAEVIQPPPIYKEAEVIQPPPIIQPPRVIQSPPIIKPPRVIDSPPIYNPPRVIESPPIIKPPRVIESPPIIKPPRVIESPPIVKPPRYIDSPPIYRPPQVIQSPPIYKPPQVIQSPPIIRPPQIIQPPAIVRPPRIIQSPPIVRPPQIIQSPPIVRPPQIIQSPPIVRPPQIIQSPPIVRPPQIIQSPPIVRPPQIIQSPPIVNRPQTLQYYRPPTYVRPPVSVCPTMNCLSGSCGYNQIGGRQTCSSHSSCSNGRCCFVGARGTLQCTNAATAYANQRSYRNIMTNSSEASTNVELYIGDWNEKNVTNLLVNYLLPIEMDHSTSMNVSLWAFTAEQRDAMNCGEQDKNCVASKLVSCVIDIEQHESGLNQSTYDVQESEYTDSNDSHVGQLPQHRQLSSDSQPRVLSLMGCILQVVQSNLPEQKGSVLMAVKRCVRSHLYDWAKIQSCVATSPEDEAELPIYSMPPSKPLEIAVNHEMVASVENHIPLSFCLSLNSAGVTPILCDILYDDLEDELITSPDDLLTAQDEGYPQELLRNTVEEIEEIEFGHLNEDDAAQEQDDASSSENSL